MRQKVVSQGGGRRHTATVCRLTTTQDGGVLTARAFRLCTRPDPAKALKSGWPAKGPKLAALKQRAFLTQPSRFSSCGTAFSGKGRGIRRTRSRSLLPSFGVRCKIAFFVRVSVSDCPAGRQVSSLIIDYPEKLARWRKPCVSLTRRPID